MQKNVVPERRQGYLCLSGIYRISAVISGIGIRLLIQTIRLTQKLQSDSAALLKAGLSLWIIGRSSNFKF